MVAEFLAPSAVRPSLPLPTRERWEPLRAGIIGVWQYPDQEFVFHRGRLILMGRNGAGKTKVLELLFPFLLDARNDARRLSPGGGEGRTWRWNLLEIGKDGTPVRRRGDGIVWLEFGRRGHAGAMEFATIGARLSAVFGSDRVAIAWFLTDQRPGEEVEFTSPLGDGSTKRIPLSRDGLETAIGDRGQVFEQRGAYVHAIDDRLFGLGNRYEGLMHLLIRLRQPKLSEKLDLDLLVTHLRDALPPLDDDKVRQLADALDSLREDDASLERMKRARGAVGRFLEDYGDYATREARAVADRVRSTEEGVRQAQRRVRSAEEAAERAEREVERLGDLIERTKGELVELAGQIEAHLASPEMRAAEQLRLVEEAAQTARTDEGRFAAGADAMEEEAASAEVTAATAVTEAALARAAFEAAVSAAETAAGRAAMGTAHARYREALAHDLRADTGETMVAIEARRRALEALATSARELAEVRTRLGDAKAAVTEAQGRVRDATARHAAADEAAATARTAVAEALVEWAAGLAEIGADDAQVAELLEAIDAGRRGADAAADLAAPVRAAIASATGALETRDAGLEGRRKALEAEREQVLATPVSRPAPSATRTADRAGRAGAPLYEVVDFVQTTSARDAAGIEAALEAAGLLDAWVTPNGVLLPADVADAALVPTAPLAGTTLAAVLVPAGDAVPASAVGKILASIGLGERADGPWVGLDGRFALGPLAGAFAKPDAGFIGAGAQALTRARRVADLDAAIAALDGERATLEDERGALVRRSEVVDGELARLPSDDALVTARRTTDGRAADVERETMAMGRLEDRERELTIDETRRTNLLGEATAGLGFPPGQTDIAAARDALGDFRTAIGELAGAARSAASAADAEARTTDGAERIRGKATTARAEHAAKDREAAEQEAKAAELRSLHGSSAQAAITRLVSLRSTKKCLDDELGAAETALGDAREGRGRTTTEIGEVRARLTDAEGRRTDAAAAFGRFAATPLFGLATDVVLDGDTRGWAVRRIVEAARTAIDTSDRASFDPSARVTASKTVYARFGELNADIGADFGLAIDPTLDDGLLIVDAQHGDERVPVASLASFLERTIAEQEAQLDARSRQILSRYLFDGVGEELGDRIREARSLIARMNAELDRCPTASGLRIHLRWELAPSVPEGADEATNLLLTDTSLLHATDRERIVAFLGARVNDARELEDSAGFSDALVEALDYRRWFAFTIEEVLPGNRHHRLNPKDFPTGSGGEKAVTLHLPLFAAVAAYYTGDASNAPRLFFLDEAFAGIDRPMRGSMMGFIRRFDLDFVMTTPDDWATYAELDGTSIYQLHRDPSLRAVYAHRWTWTGAELLDEEALRALDEAAG